MIQNMGSRRKTKILSKYELDIVVLLIKVLTMQTRLKMRRYSKP